MESQETAKCIDFKYVSASLIVLACFLTLVGYLWGRSDADVNYKTLVCGNDIRGVIYGKYIDKKYILFMVKNDQPRVVSTKICRLSY